MSALNRRKQQRMGYKGSQEKEEVMLAKAKNKKEQTSQRGIKYKVQTSKQLLNGARPEDGECKQGV